MLFLLLNHKTIPTRGASAPQKPVRVHPKPGYALGEESRTGTGPRQQQDRPPTRSQPRTTPGSAANSPGRRNRGPATATAARTAGGPAHAGQRTDHHHGPPAPRHRQRRHDRQQDRERDTRPRSRPRQQDRPTARHSAHAAQDAHRTRHAPPYYYIHPSPTTARQGARQRPTLDSWTARRQDIESGYMQI